MTDGTFNSDVAMEEATLGEDIPEETAVDNGTEGDIRAADDITNDKGETERGSVDYEAFIREDVAALKAQFPELSDINDVTDLDDPLRYAALRDLGLTPKEAYLATAKRSYSDTRSHLRRASGRNAAAASSLMSPGELAAARDIFPGKSDADIQRLYKRVRG